MFSLFSKQEVFGLDIGYETIKLVQIQKNGQSLNLVGAIEQPLTERIMELDHFKNKAKAANLIKEACSKALPNPIHAKNIVSALPESFVFSKTLQLPKMSDNDYINAVKSEAAQYLPIPIEEAYIDYQVLIVHPDEPLADLLFVAAPKKLVDEYIEVIRMAGFDLFALETKPIAVGRAVSKEKNLSGAIIVEIGTELTRISIWDNNTIRLTTSVALGKNQIASALNTENGKSAADSIAANALLTSTTDEIVNSIKYHQSRDYRPNPITKIFLCGSGAKINGIDSCFERELRIETEIIEPKTSSKNPLGTEFITAYGLALRSSIE